MEPKHELKTWVCEPAAWPAAFPKEEFLELDEIEFHADEEHEKIMITIYTDNSIIEIELY